MRQLKRAAGLTLVELLVAMAVVALLVMGATPYFSDYIANARLREGGNLLFSEALAAQSEAIKRNGTIRLSANGGTVQVLDPSTAPPTQLRLAQMPAGLSTPAVTVDFGADGLTVPFGTAAAINVTMTGVTCSSNFRCPGLRVDAGGAVRLCTDTTIAGC